MRVVFISLSMLIILISTKIFATNQITRRNLQYDSSNDYAERLDVLEKEHQNLLGRIEIIEHNMAKLERMSDSAKQELPIEVNTDVTKNLTENVEEDVFAIPSATSTQEQRIIDSDKSTSETPKDKQLYDLALASLKDNKLVEAEEKFANFLEKHPKSPLLSNVYFWYGESFFRRNMFDKAAINYLKGYKQSPKGPKASDCLLKLALSLGELKKLPESCSILDKLEAEFPSRAATSMKKAKDARVKFNCKRR